MLPTDDPKINTGITLRKSVMGRLDAVRGDTPRSRVIERMLEERLGIPSRKPHGGDS